MSAAWSSHPLPGTQECGLLAQQPVAPKGGVCVYVWLEEKEGAGPRNDTVRSPIRSPATCGFSDPQNHGMSEPLEVSDCFHPLLQMWKLRPREGWELATGVLITVQDYGVGASLTPSPTPMLQHHGRGPPSGRLRGGALHPPAGFLLGIQCINCQRWEPQPQSRC